MANVVPWRPRVGAVGVAVLAALLLAACHSNGRSTKVTALGVDQAAWGKQAAVAVQRAAGGVGSTTVTSVAAPASPSPSSFPATSRPPSVTTHSSSPTLATTTTKPPPTTGAAAPGTLAVTLQPAQPPTTAGSPTYTGVAVLNPDGRGWRVLAGDNYHAPIWTPDGRFVIMQDAASDGIVAVPYVGGSITPLATGLTPALSPDGTRLAYSTLGVPGVASPQIVIQHVTEDGSALLATGSPTYIADSAVDLRWSPNGQELLFGRIPPGGVIFSGAAASTGHVIVRHGDGSEVDLLAGAPITANLAIPLTWSPDGTLVEFAATGGNTLAAQILSGPDLVNSDGRNLRGLTLTTNVEIGNDSNTSNVGGTWVPGHDVVAVSNFPAFLLVNTSQTVVSTIQYVIVRNHVVVADPNHAIYATTEGGLSFDPTGRVIYFAGEPGDGTGYSVYAVSIDGTWSQRLTRGFNIEVAPAVCP